MLNAIMLDVVMLNVIMLNVVMLNIFMLFVVAPLLALKMGEKMKQNTCLLCSVIAN